MWQPRFTRTRGHQQWPNDGSDTGLEDHYQRPAQYSQQIRALLPGQHPQGNIVHDMNKPPFAPQQGLPGTNPAQQAVHSGGQSLVYHQPQQVASRQPQNNVPSGTPPSQHPSQAFYPQQRSQGPTRQMQAMQGPGQASNMPMNMMGNPNAGNQQAYYANRSIYMHNQPVHQMQQQHYVFNPHQQIPAPHYQRFPSAHYQAQQPSQVVYAQQQPGYASLPYFPSLMAISHQQPRQNMLQQQVNVQPAPPGPVRERCIIRITDPNTKKDVTDDILSNNRERVNSSQATDGAVATARGTPPPTPPNLSETSDIPAQFARQVAMAASMDGPMLGATGGQEPAPGPAEPIVPVPPPHVARQALAAEVSIADPDLASQPVLPKEAVVPAINGRDSDECDAAEESSMAAEEAAAEDTTLEVDEQLSQQEIEAPGINAEAAAFEPQSTPIVEVAPLPSTVAVAAEAPQEPEVHSAPHTVVVLPPPSVPLASQPPRLSSDIVMHKPPQSLPPFPPQKAAAAVVVEAAPAPVAAPPQPQRTVIKEMDLQFGSIDSIPSPVEKSALPPPPGMTTAVVQILSEQPAVAAAIPQSSPPKPAVQAQPQPAPVSPQAQPASRPVQLPPTASQPRQNGEVAAETMPNSVADGFDNDAKDPKKQKGKRKPKETNRKGETKEGGEMDAFLDKDESTLPSVTAVVVSAPPPPEDTPTAVEVVDERENDVTEEMQDEEEKRKVAEKNMENAKVSSQGLEQDENVPVISEPELPVKITLKYNYPPDQWSPLNPEGKMQYDRAFLLELQQQPMSQKRPEGLPNLEVIRDSNGGKPRGAYEPRGGGGMVNRPMVGHDFTPSYVPGGPPSGRQQMRGRPSQQGTRREQPQMPMQPARKVVSLSLNQDIKLHESTDAWKPGSKLAVAQDPEVEKTEKLFRKVRAMLNKLTPQNFGTLMNQVASFEINNEQRLSGVIDLVFEKAIDEPSFSVAYANMCKKLSSMKVPSVKGGEFVNFKKLIITKCQKEFERDDDDTLKRDIRTKEIAAAETEEKKKELTLEMEDAERKSKHRSLGNIRFIGELFKLSVLTANIMHDCLSKLISTNTEDSIESLCRLLTTIGKGLEPPPPPPGKPKSMDPRMEDYFKKMKDLAQRKEISSRVRFMLQDVIELRAENWNPRRFENAPKTIDQIHQEAVKEQMEEQDRDRQSRSMPMPKRPDDRDKRGNMGGGMGKRGGMNENDGGGQWNTVISNKRTTITVDPGKTKINRPQEMDEDQIQLGPTRTVSWGRGSSGGIKNNSQEGERSSSGPNRFSALAQDHSSNADRRNNSRPTAVQLNRDRDNRGRGTQLPPMSQRTTGKPPPSREREQALAYVKTIAGSETAPRYQPQGSRDSSATRDSERKEAPESRQKPAPVQEIDRDAVEKKIKNILDEFLHVNDIKDAILNVSELASMGADALPIFVTDVFNQVLERSLLARQHTGLLFTGLVNQKVLTLDQFNKGLREVLESAEDMEIDVPMFWQYLAEILAPMYEGMALPLTTLRLYTTALPNKSLHEKLLTSVMNVVGKNMLKPKLRELWQASNMQVSHFLPQGSDVRAFMEAKQLGFLEGDAPAAGGAAASECVSVDSIQAGLKQLFQTKQRNEQIFDWINAHVPEAQQKQPPFIRALITAIASSAIKTKDDGNLEFDQSPFDTLCTVIKRYVDNKDKLELETLYALQLFVHSHQHPPNLLSQFFEVLYDAEVISEEAFSQWKSADVPREREGHAIAVKSVNQFLNYVASNKEQEDDEEGA